ncbi:MAG: hypothetical protein FWD12_15140, partial [Alphaproteobacteria bacterium]|nr:hypothetical protein [Alphaproteobacteria bacterium]
RRGDHIKMLQVLGPFARWIDLDDGVVAAGDTAIARHICGQALAGSVAPYAFVKLAQHGDRARHAPAGTALF